MCLNYISVNFTFQMCTWIMSKDENTFIFFFGWINEWCNYVLKSNLYIFIKYFSSFFCEKLHDEEDQNHESS